MNNSVFGKTMENTRNRLDVKLCSDGEETEKLIAKPVFEYATIFTENLVASHFKKCLLTENPIYKKQTMFRTRMHEIYMVEQNKKALSAHDDKRHILENSINTLAWGHHQIKVKKDQFRSHLKKLAKFVCGN